VKFPQAVDEILR